MTKQEIDAPTPEQLLDQLHEGHVLSNNELMQIIEYCEVMRRAQTRAITTTLKQLAFECRPCIECGHPIWLIHYKKPGDGENVRKMPISEAFQNHWADCPQAEAVKKRLRRREGPAA